MINQDNNPKIEEQILAKISQLSPPGPPLSIGRQHAYWARLFTDFPITEILSHEELSYLFSPEKLNNVVGGTNILDRLFYSYNPPSPSFNDWLEIIIKNTDLKNPALLNNPLSLAFASDRELTAKQWDLLIKGSDLKKSDSSGWTPLIYFVTKQRKRTNLMVDHIDYLLNNSDIDIVDTSGRCVLFLALTQDFSLPMTKDQWWKLIKGTNLNDPSRRSRTPIAILALTNQKQNIDDEQLIYIIKNSNLKEINDYFISHDHVPNDFIYNKFISLREKYSIFDNLSFPNGCSPTPKI